MSAATPYLRLPLAFDVERMRADLAAIGEEAWIAHYNTGAYENGWRCVPLRSVDGRADHIMALEEGAYQDTHWLQRCPYLREVIASFRCETTSGAAGCGTCRRWPPRPRPRCASKAK